MAGSQRVQQYLEKHKIGLLFEELMGKVIADQPDDPILYLVKTLDRKANRQGHALRRSMDGDGLSVPKERGYEKPWQTNSKKMRGKDSSPERPHVKRTSTKPEWDGSMKTETFDELWESQKFRGQRSASPSRKAGGATWADSGATEEDFYNSYGYSGPRRRAEEIDSLSGEFTVSKQAGSDTNVKTTVPVVKSKGLQRDSLKHKQELQKIILSKKAAEDSGIEDDRDLQDDDALELMESAADLQNEGVTNIKASKGISVRSTTRDVPSPEAAVRVSICARCAKVMSGEPSVLAPGVGDYGQLEDYDYDVDKGFPNSRPQSAVRFSPDTARGSDEEFESVSQVTGPRRPVWQDDSDSETVTPRKGKHMFASSTVPSKGRHMYSPEPAEPNLTKSNLKQTAVAVAQSANFQQSASRGRQGDLKGHSAFHKTWSPELDSSDGEDVRTTHSLTSGRGGWNVQNYEDDEASSFYGSPGHKGRRDNTGPY